ncbi:CDP-glycerol glycerophosphotransferase family protein [Glycomyces arizonensis]|uniref:CDP-glycerol glycerophosphotransferase family protein n=1 Tax=Glycomyces arizonensis TaxID=256035 RepID=UPI0004245E5F|nr:CDP-glycerol glycerophosphotransferase family protein [Glycomyces arizonensis]
MTMLRRLLSRTASTGFAALALVLALLPDLSWAAVVAAAAALAIAWRGHRDLGPGRARFDRGVAVAAIAVVAAQSTGGSPIPAAIAAGALITVVGLEPQLAVAVATGHMASANLETGRGRGWFTPRAIGDLVNVAVALFAAAAAATMLWASPVPLWLAVIAVIGVLGTAAVGAAAALLRRRRSAHTGDAAVIRAVGALDPVFVVHFSGPPGSAYQLRMWLPYLDLLGDPYVVISREAGHLGELRSATTAPIVVAPSMSEVEQLLAPGVKAAFYVNGSALNTHLVRFGNLRHLQLFHGESDKASSFNKVTTIYDEVFVAGQAAVDRYRAHGLDLTFRKVGRPQLAAVASGPRAGSGARPVLLYAPTWTGLTSEFDYSSLPIGKAVVSEALRRDMDVIVRAHPYTRFNLAASRQLDSIERLLAEDAERTGRAHRWGPRSTGDFSLVDCINAADVAVCDISGVATDWIASDRPFAVTDMGMLGDRFADEAWIARGAYRLAGDAGNLGSVFDELLDTDSKAVQRKETREYFLGGANGESGVEAFLAAARDAYRG